MSNPTPTRYCHQAGCSRAPTGHLWDPVTCPTPEPDAGDVEALTKVIVSHQRIPTYRGPGRQRCSGCDSLRDQTDGPNSPRHAAHVAEQILSSDWIAAHDAKVARDTAERIAQAIEARDSVPVEEPGLYVAARLAREEASRG